MNLIEADLNFNFSDAINAIKFDDSEHELTHCMSAVDFVVELSEAYLFVEVKDPSNPEACNRESFDTKLRDGKLQKSIVKKFRDSFVYRWAENKLEKPVHFLVLITLDEAQLNNVQDQLQRELPFRGSSRWSRQMAASCQVINIDAWNRNFPRWPVRRLSETVN